MIEFELNQEVGEPIADSVWQKSLVAIDQTIKTSDLAVSIAIVDEGAMQKLNKQYRGKDKVTDVLSFAEHDVDNDEFGEQKNYLGEVIICYQKASQQAQEKGVKLDEELRRLFVHGVLHLLSYDHEVESEAKEMEALEDEILAQF